MFEGFLGNAFEGLDHACNWGQAVQMPAPPLRDLVNSGLGVGPVELQGMGRIFSHFPQQEK